MGNTAYLYYDWVKDLAAANITITNEDSNYPEANCQDEQVALCTRTTAKVGIKIQLNLGSAQSPQIFAILNHNFLTGTFDINSYTAADYTTGKTAVEVNKAVRPRDVYHYESVAPTARQYWEFDLTNVASSDSFFEFGRIMVYGGPSELTESQAFERGRGYGFHNIVNETPHGIRWIHKLTEKQERFTLHWSTKANTSIPAELKTLFDTVYGNAYPFLFIPDLATTDCYYVYINQDELPWLEMRGMADSTLVSNISIDLIEAIRGKAV